MKKHVLGFVMAAALTAGALTGCGGSGGNATSADTQSAQDSGETTASAAANEASSQAPDAGESASEELITIKVGASPAPHAEILNAAKDILVQKGFNLEIVEYTDYVQPNNALEAGDLDANYFQHKPYLDQFNEQNGTKLASAGVIHYEPFGIYAGKSSSVSDLADKAKVAVPNDVTNEARALLLLQDQGLIKLKEGAGLEATRNDIVENPKNLEIMELEAAQIPRSLEDVDIAVINGNYAIAAGLKVSDALAVEASDSLAAQTYGNVVAVREGDVESASAKALAEALQSDEVKKFIEDTYEGAVVPMF